MTITIECKWDEGDLVPFEIRASGRKIVWSYEFRELFLNTEPFLKEVARWQKEQNRKQTERDE